MLCKEVIGLFEPPFPLKYLPPVDTAPEKRCTASVSGVAEYVKLLNGSSGYVPTKSRLQEQHEARLAKKALAKQALNESLASWDPTRDPHALGDPYRTLFVGRLRYTVDEADLEQEFSRFGPIERVRVVRDRQNQSRGYAFVVFEEERFARVARREADGIALKGRRIITDYERARSTSGWLPRRLGGGKGGRNAIVEQLKQQLKKRPQSQYDGAPNRQRFPRRGRDGFESRAGDSRGPPRRDYGRMDRGGYSRSRYDRSSAERGGHDRGEYLRGMESERGGFHDGRRPGYGGDVGRGPAPVPAPGGDPRQRKLRKY